MLRWQWQRMRTPPRRSPAADAFARAQPDLARPNAPASEIRITWVGQSTFLLQIGGLNLLTDPVFSERASPLQWLGPARFSPPGIALRELPPLHAVLLSHDHYDHLDAPTVRQLARAHPSALWLSPLGYAGFLRRRGAQRIAELDWWQDQRVSAGERVVTCTSLPAQHWTRRVGSRPNARLWCSWCIATEESRIYFAGDSGYGPVFQEIGQRMGPFAAALLPIGAYEPRWFMRPAHMNPEEAVQAFLDLRADQFLAMHWATFRLTDEDPLEPPLRVRAAWQRGELPGTRLHIPVLGETTRLSDACPPPA